ncbi:UNVERIFIED_ORG: hypothetical protein J2W85_004083 [Ensifer adhaerens]|nr:hypothetical protein [Ensifer adhaerens]
MIPVVAVRPDGLGTRLLSIAYARQFAQKLGAPLKVAWPSLEDRNYLNSPQILKEDQIGEIFDGGKIFKDRDDVEVLEAKILSGKRLMHLHGIRDTFACSSIAEIVAMAAEFDYIVYDIPEAGLVRGEVPDEDNAKIKQTWDLFNFSADVTAAFQKIQDEADLSHAVAIHFRRGDVVNKITVDTIDELKRTGATQIFQRFLPLRTAVGIVRNRFADVHTCVICSEDAQMQARLQAYLPGRRVISANGIFPEGGNKAALLDLLILSNAGDLISPFKSYFSECASILGRCRVHNSGLDIMNFVDEVVVEIEKTMPNDARMRKAIFFAFGFNNLWYEPQSGYRRFLHRQASILDGSVVNELISVEPE